MKSVDDSGSSNSMSNNISVGLDMNLGLSADLVNNVFAFLNKSCLRDCLSLSGALLLGSALLSLSALLFSSTLLGISALLLGGTRLLSGTLLGVSALLLGGTLWHVSALLLSGGGALLVGDIPHNVGAGLLSVSGALLLRNLAGSGGTLGDTSGGAFLLVFCSEVGDSSCVAFRICDCGTRTVTNFRTEHKRLVHSSLFSVLKLVTVLVWHSESVTVVQELSPTSEQNTSAWCIPPCFLF